MTTRTLLAAVMCAVMGVAATAAEREWQNGTWRETNIERPKVLFSVQSRDPTATSANGGGPRDQDVRHRPSTHRLELRQMPRRHAAHRRIARPAGGYRNRQEDGVREGRRWEGTQVESAETNAARTITPCSPAPLEEREPNQQQHSEECDDHEHRPAHA